MMNWRKILNRRTTASEHGATAIEMALLVSFLGGGTITATTFMGDQITSTYNKVTVDASAVPTTTTTTTPPSPVMNGSPITFTSGDTPTWSGYTCQNIYSPLTGTVSSFVFEANFTTSPGSQVRVRFAAPNGTVYAPVNAMPQSYYQYPVTSFVGVPRTGTFQVCVQGRAPTPVPITMSNWSITVN